MDVYWRFLWLIRKELYGAIFGIMMSFIASLSSIALMGTATWFLSAMAVAGFYDVVLNIFIPSALIRLLAVARTLLRYGERYYTHDATFRLIAYLRVFLFERALDLKLEEAVRLKSSDLQRRLQVDLERLEMIYVRQFVPFVCAVLMGLLLGAILCAFAPILALVTIFLMLIAGVLMPLLATRLTRKHSVAQNALGRTLSDEMTDFIHGFFDLVLLGKHYQRAANFLMTANQLALARAKIIFWDQFSQVVLLFCSELTLLALLGLSIPLVKEGVMSGPQMIMLAVVAMASYEMLVPLSAAFLNLPYVMYSAARISDMLKITELKHDLRPDSEALLKAANEQDEQKIEQNMSAKWQQQWQSQAAAHAATGGALSKLSSFASLSSSAAHHSASAAASTHSTTAPAASRAAATDAPGQAAAIDASSPAAATDASRLAMNPGVLEVKVDHLSFSYSADDDAWLYSEILGTSNGNSSATAAHDFAASINHAVADTLVAPLLQDINLTLRSDRNYLIKAPSGRGKSTLVMLLTKLLRPQQGEISLNGVPYHKLRGASVRSYFAVALQDITIFSGTIFETFKQVKPQVTRQEVMAALEIVELLKLVQELPHGLDEWLGSTGLTISGGQARRLCLARALIAGDFPLSKQVSTAAASHSVVAVASATPAAAPAISAPAALVPAAPDSVAPAAAPTAVTSTSVGKFIILDEPGEGLDEAQEKRIIERIQERRKGIIIITHKQAGARLADELISL